MLPHSTTGFAGLFVSLTLYGWFPRTTLLPLLLSVNRFHVAELTLVAAVVLGN
jgi:hypothetical protein